MERQSRIRPKAAVSGSRPSPRLPSPTPRAIGAPRWGVPSVTTSETRSVQGCSTSVATAPAARMIRPPMECPTRAIRRTSTGHASTTSLQQGGERDAVLAQAQTGVGAQEDRGPALGRQRLAVRRAEAGRDRGSSRTRSRRARAGRPPAGRWRPGRRRRARPARGVRRVRRARTAIGMASCGRSRTSRSPIRPLTAELTKRPARGRPRAAAPPRCRRPCPGRSPRARRPRPRPPYTAAAIPRCTRSDSVAVSRERPLSDS